MSNADRYRFSDFTREQYRELLRLAKLHYTDRTFTNFQTGERFVIWRHDLDSSVHAALAIARIEAEEGVRGAYFVRLRSDFYNLLEKDCLQRVLKIADLGHEVGLHFESDEFAIHAPEDLEAALTSERRLLESVLGRPVETFSFHLTTPLALEATSTTYAGMVNATSTRFREDVGYCSDSNGYWRYRRLRDVLEEGSDRNLQVLTHPEYWTDEIMSPRQKILRCIDGRAGRTLERYVRHLETWDRPNIDWN